MESRRINTKVRCVIGALGTIVSMLLLQAVYSPVRADSSDFNRRPVAALESGGVQPEGPLASGYAAQAPTPTRPDPGVSSDMMDGTWSLLQPQERLGHNAIYDPDGDRILVFGGYDGSSYRNDVWEYSFKGGVWRELPIPLGSRPSPRYYSAAVYDPVRKNMVVFGGYGGGGRVNDTWSLSLQTGTWTHLTTTGGPTPRYIHAAIYHSASDQMMIFGGDDGSNVSDTWELSLQSGTWTQLTTSGGPPSGRQGSTAIFDSARNRMVISGGWNGSSLWYGDTWALQFPANVWSQLPTSGDPIARQGHAAIYDPVRDRMVIVGGYVYGGYKNDSWALPMNTLVWAPLGVAPFSERYAHSLVYDSLRGCMVLFGGGGATYRADMWRAVPENPVNWTLVNSAGSPPSARSYSASVYDSRHDWMVLFGGNNAVVNFNDVWTYRPWGLPRWDQVVTSGTKPAARSNHSAIYDPLWRRMLVFGGQTDGGGLLPNDAWALSLQDSTLGRWTQVAVLGTPPSPRKGHTAIYDPVRYRMVVFGGNDGSVRDDTWVLTITGEWQQIFPDVSEGTPASRWLHTATYDPSEDRMVVFGGCSDGSGSSRLNDIWALSFNPPKWRHLTPPGGPSPRYAHTAVYNSVDATMVVFGGYTGGGFVNDSWKLDLAPGHTVLWAQLSPSGPLPTPRHAHTAIFRPRLGSAPVGTPGDALGRMVVFGGSCLRYNHWGVDDGTSTLLWLGPGTTVSTPPGVNSARFALNQNWPNPFNPTTTISFDLPVASSVRLQLVDVAGRVVRELVRQDLDPGTHKVNWDGRDNQGMKVASGTYLYRITAGSFSETRKLVLLR